MLRMTAIQKRREKIVIALNFKPQGNISHIKSLKYEIFPVWQVNHLATRSLSKDGLNKKLVYQKDNFRKEATKKLSNLKIQVKTISSADKTARF